MAALGMPGGSHGLVFKGGTALRLCYFENYRYSADLDFSMVEGDIQGAYATVERALALVTGAVNGLGLTGDVPSRIAYQGPLGRQRCLKLDISDDEQVLNVDTVRLLSRWPDLPETGMIPVYPLVEIAGEKLRCVMQRMQCRDLFDIWFLFEHADMEPHDMAEVFKLKATHRNLDPDEFEMRYRSRLDQYRRRRDNELHVPGKVPHIEQVERTVTRLLRGVGLL